MVAVNINPDTRESDGAPAERAARPLPPAAQRALAEAAARRANLRPERPREIDGRGGEDPIRYGDWEVKGLAVDF
jgi:hypothetical protein